MFSYCIRYLCKRDWRLKGNGSKYNLCSNSSIQLENCNYYFDKNRHYSYLNAARDGVNYDSVMIHAAVA